VDCGCAASLPGLRFIVFVKVGLGGAGFLTEFTELTKLADHQELGCRRAAVGVILSDASLSSVLSVSSVVNLFRISTSFVSFSVIRRPSVHTATSRG
jgi:hypothetical protein